MLAKLFTKLILTAIFTLGSADSAGENAKEFRDLCVIYKLLTAVPHEPKMAPIGPANKAETAKERMKTILAKIINLNLTATEPQMTEALNAKEKCGTAAKLQEENSPVKNLFAGIDSKLLDTMIKDYNDLQDNSEKLKAFNAEYGVPLSESKKQIIRPKLTRLANAAADLNTRITTLNSTITVARLQTRWTLLGGLYSHGATPTINSPTYPAAALTEIPTTQFSWADSSNRTATCKKVTETAAHAGNALATDLFCLCFVANSTQIDACGTQPVVSGRLQQKLRPTSASSKRIQSASRLV
uniref:Variant surface glycoprotein 1125.1528 n=1 Tax=Trypanosoma brucei TaxID=5691 RepID=A0A1J0R7E4_9TRYP|nr:variant surface glycoprotein 1125.1528 [Trypanosoma brucei]